MRDVTARNKNIAALDKAYLSVYYLSLQAELSVYSKAEFSLSPGGGTPAVVNIKSFPVLGAGAAPRTYGRFTDLVTAGGGREIGKGFILRVDAAASIFCCTGSKL